jgi:predicted Zn-ribbon and HTH transcriptional regulator
MGGSMAKSIQVCIKSGQMSVCGHLETENGVCSECGVDVSGDAPVYSKQRCPVCDRIVPGRFVEGAFRFDHECGG